jgi:hypothetical protein
VRHPRLLLSWYKPKHGLSALRYIGNPGKRWEGREGDGYFPRF